MVTKIKLSFFVFLLYSWAFLFSKTVWAGAEEYRQCSDAETCEVGEFLYDDSYAPITGATCNLTSRDPGGVLFLNNVVMSSTADGWYYYDVNTVSQTLGLYRSQVCCTVGSDYLCIDKSFEIATPASGLTESQVAGAVWDADTADHNTADTFGENLQTTNSLSVSDIWDYPQRSLTSFGTLAADIWDYSSRSISSFSSLVSDIWNSSDRTLTSADLDDGNLTTDNQTGTTVDLGDQIDEITEEVKANRYILEQLINAPIIETFIEEGEESPTSLQAKIKETKKIARFLSSDIGNLKKQIIALNTNWDDSSYKIALNEMTTASRVLGASTINSSEPETIGARVNWLEEKWKNPIIGNLSNQTASALANISSISREIKSYGKTFISKQYLDITSEHLDKLNQAIGQEEDLYDQETLFGYIASLEKISDALIRESLEVDNLFQNWNQYTDYEKDRKLTRIQKSVLEINSIVDADALLKPKVGDDSHRKNQALALQGLIDSNLILLVQDSNQPLQNIWLEYGSIIFRSLINNPSDTIAQTINIKYYLPQEISLEHIIKIEDDLEAIFDAEKNALYVSGTVDLDPGETKTLIVETIDVWVISEEEISSINKQTQTLFDSLKNTSYFAQGSTLKADIEVNLDKIVLLQKNDQTPELKIKSHREAMLELESAKSKLDNLKTIVSAAGSVGTLFGFVGGVQVIAVWGLIIILIAGFVFLSIYLKKTFGSGKEKDVSSATNSDIIANSGSNSDLNMAENSSISDNKSELERENAAIRRSLAENKNSSTWGLLKEIIAIKLGIGSKATNSRINKNNKKIPFLIKIIFLLVGSLLMALILLGRKNTSATNMISPMVDPGERLSFEENFYTEPQTWTTTNPNVEEEIVERNTESGFVLGAEQEDFEEDEINGYGTKYLVMVKIPNGYKGINVRDKPSVEGTLVSRLWFDQEAYVLKEENGWVFINTNPEDGAQIIEGWIVKKPTTKL